MNTREILQHYIDSDKLQNLLQLLEEEKKHVHINGVSGSFPAFVIAAAFTELKRPIVYLTTDPEEARYTYQDVHNILGKSSAFYLPSSYIKPYETDSPSNNAIQERSEIILQLNKSDKPRIIIGSAESLAELVINQDNLSKNQFDVSIGEQLDLEFMLEVLQTYSFEREDFVYEPGQFSIRGGIIDVFSYSHDTPIRIELDGRQIESIRSFDTVSQLSISDLRYTSIVPNLLEEEIAGQKVSIFHYLPKDTLFFANGLGLCFSELQASLSEENEKDYTSVEALKKELTKRAGVEFGQVPHFRNHETISFRQSPQTTYGKNFQLLADHLNDNARLGIDQHIFSESGKQIERLETIFDDLDKKVLFHPVYMGLSQGFLDEEHRLSVYTEHQIFGKHYQFRNKHKYSKNQALTLRELSNLKPGDFIVHIDHGVGRFEGLQKIEMGGRLQESVRLSYQNNDLLYVNIGSLHKISRYTGKEGHTPKINKLGSDAWTKLKSKTKKRVKDIARDLINLYAKRKAQPGYEYAPDSYMQVELEASFLYEDTPDQAKATEDVKKDMESPHPMDRLVCGDVGFGKTEIAIRAAFKAVADSKQVAVLVPTTILAQQHYHTFKDRMDGFPCTVDYINRFRTSKQQTESIKKLAEGKTDIIIGTHRLLSNKIKFKDLGLLVIDEEQKFGVAAKEKLKSLRANVDTLTLTATPIPRTLHFSLMGARDLSIINTPPPNRQPTKTSLHVFSTDVFKDAVNYELDRGGQVFVVHNRVRDIQDVADMIRSVAPRARVVVGHGQMAGDELENVMLRFIDGEYDVLVATTIIESGLDIPNANTILINNAHYFGLSDLHQMRGRVGRSNKKAFCHLITPPLYSLTDDARRRLQAIEEFSELGSGFNVAMRDLDIRGAGNLLGGEQSGFISEIGFDMYHKILDEAVKELRNDEFKDLFDDEEDEMLSNDCQVETDLDIMIPDNYITNISERLSLYTELSKVDNDEKLIKFRDELKDRFGPLPRQVKDLLHSVRLKHIGIRLGIERIRIKNGKLAGYFPDENNTAYYSSDLFGNIMAKVNSHPDKFRLSQKGSQLLLITEQSMKDIKSFLEVLRLLIS